MTIDEAKKIKTVVENKDYIVQLVNAVAKSMIEAFENLKIEDVNMFQLGYNKAIDEFASELENHSIYADIGKGDEVKMEWVSPVTRIKEVAEQLKAGD